MSLFVLLYIAISPLLARRYSEKGRYYAWLIIVVGLIVPVRPQWGNNIIRVYIPNKVALPSVQVVGGTPIDFPVIFQLPTENITPIIATPTEYTSQVFALPNVDWWQIFFLIWIVGLVTFSVYHAIKHYRFMQMVNRWSEKITDSQIFVLLQDLKSEMKISKHMDIYKCESITSPMMIGFVNPRILLPNTDFANNELRFILKHELVHYKRKDLYYKCLVLIATAIHWFNPIVYLMAKAISVQCELSCDVETVKNADTDTRQLYSKAIINVVQRKSNIKTALSTNFYGGKKGMKKRIYTIMDSSRKKAGIAIFCAVLVTTIGASFVFTANGSTPEIAFTQEANILEVGIPYVGEAHRVWPIVHALPLPAEDWVARFISIGEDLDSGFAPYTLSVFYEPMNLNADMTVRPEQTNIFFENANLLFELIGNLEEVIFTVRLTPSNGYLDKDYFDYRIAIQKPRPIERSMELIIREPNEMFLDSILPRDVTEMFLDYKEWGIEFIDGWVTTTEDGGIEWTRATDYLYRGQQISIFSDNGIGLWFDRNEGNISVYVNRDENGYIIGLDVEGF